MTTPSTTILRSNLIQALRMAIKEQAARERQPDDGRKSSFLAGLEANLAALEAGLPLQVR